VLLTLRNPPVLSLRTRVMTSGDREW
jgi:hypothetical protein